MNLAEYTTVSIFLQIITILITFATGSIYQDLFYRAPPEYGTWRIGVAGNAPSALICALRNQKMYPNLGSFLFSPETKLCIPASAISKSGVRPSSVEGYLYSKLQVSPYLSVMSYGNTTACVGIFNQTVSYQETVAECEDRGFFLISVKNWDKLMIVKSLARENSVWVGCDDTTTENMFIKKEDGSEVTIEVRHEVFEEGEPNTKSNQDCCRYNNDIGTLGDFNCSLPHKFVCEISVHYCP